MSMSAHDPLSSLFELVRESFRNPRGAGEALLRLEIPLQARWFTLLAAVAAGTVLAYLIPALAGRLQDMPAPLFAASFQVGVNVFAALLVTQIGRLFGGQGRFKDALLLVAWLQMLMVLVQAAQVVLLFVAPPLGGFFLIVIIGLFFWFLVGFVQALHGFTQPLFVFLGILVTLFVSAFVLSSVFVLLGLAPAGL